MENANETDDNTDDNTDDKTDEQTTDEREDEIKGESDDEIEQENNKNDGKDKDTDNKVNIDRARELGIFPLWRVPPRSRIWLEELSLFFGDFRHLPREYFLCYCA